MDKKIIVKKISKNEDNFLIYLQHGNTNIEAFLCDSINEKEIILDKIILREFVNEYGEYIINKNDIIVNIDFYEKRR